MENSDLLHHMGAYSALLHVAGHVFTQRIIGYSTVHGQQYVATYWENKHNSRNLCVVSRAECCESL